jgi:hypothetical protein
MKNVIWKYGCALALIAGLGLVGCGGDSASKSKAKAPEAPSKEAVAPKTGGGPKGGAPKGGGSKGGGKTTEGPMVEIANLKPFTYNPEFKKDPFVLPKHPDIDPSKDRFEIDQMLLYGLIRGGDMDRAFIRTPDGKDKIVKIGDPLGKHGGKITEINVDEKGVGYIVVQERYIEPQHPERELVIEKMLPLVKISKR